MARKDLLKMVTLSTNVHTEEQEVRAGNNNNNNETAVRDRD